MFPQAAFLLCRLFGQIQSTNINKFSTIVYKCRNDKCNNKGALKLMVRNVAILIEEEFSSVSATKCHLTTAWIFHFEMNWSLIGGGYYNQDKYNALLLCRVSVTGRDVPPVWVWHGWWLVSHTEQSDLSQLKSYVHQLISGHALFTIDIHKLSLLDVLPPQSQVIYVFERYPHN